MGVYCGVCGDRLSDATENYGSIPVSDKFEGWHQEPDKAATCPDTCQACYRAIVKVTTKAANAIVAQHKDAHDHLRAELHDQRQREAQFKRDEAAFRSNWRPK